MATVPNYSQPAIFSEVATPTVPDSGYLKVYANSGVLASIANGGSEKRYVAISGSGLPIGAYTLPTTDGTSSQVLQTNGSGTVTWQTVSGGGGGGITSINGDTTAAQLLTVGTSGTNFAIDSTTTPGTSVFNIPDASATARGLVTTGTQTIAGAKTFSSGITLPTGRAVGLVNDSYIGLSATANQGLWFSTGSTFKMYGRDSAGDQKWFFMESGAGFAIASGGSFHWSGSSNAYSGADLFLHRDAAGILAQRNSTNAQTFRVYNTYTSSTSYETLNIKGKASANFEFGPENGSAGGTLRGLTIGGYSAGSTTITPWLTFDNTGTAAFAGTGTTIMSAATWEFRNSGGYLNSIYSSNAAAKINIYDGSFLLQSNATSDGRLICFNDCLIEVASGKSLYVGNGRAMASPQAGIVQGTGGSGTNIAGASLTIAGGRGTGTGAGGSLVFQTAAAGTTGSSLNSLTTRLTIDSTGLSTFAGLVTVTQPVSTTGSPTVFTVTGAAHTTLTASTEATDVNFNLARTVQFATGALTTQRAMRIQAPTYSFVGASTITTASTLSISGPPVAGTNATISYPWALAVESGNSAFNGYVFLQTSGVNRGFITGTLNARTAIGAVFNHMMVSTNGIHLGLGKGYSWTSSIQGNDEGAIVAEISSSAANTIDIRNSQALTTGQTFRVYNTYTSSTSFETGQLSWVSNEFRIGSAVGSAGGTERTTVIGAWNAAGTFTAGLTVSSTGYTSGTIMAPAGTRTWGWGYHSGGPGIYGGAYMSGNDMYIDVKGASGKKLYLRNSSADICSWDMDTGSYTMSNIAATSGAITEFTLTAAAHTGQTASTEATSVNFNLSSTKQFATGALTTQRAMRIQAPTYSFVGASTITTASTLSISGPPVAGTNATITNAYALNVESGRSRFGNGILVATDGSKTTCGLAVGNESTGLYRTTQLGLGLSTENVHALTVYSTTVAMLNSARCFGWANSATDDVNQLDIGFMRDAAGIVGIRNLANYTTAQSLGVYATYTSSTSYERVNIRGKASANFEIGPENGSAGGTLRGLTIGGYSAGSTTITPWLTFTSSGTPTFNLGTLVIPSGGTGLLCQQTNIYLDSYGTHSGIRYRRSEGTEGSPTAVAFNSLLGFVATYGYHGAGYHSTQGASISFYATEAFTSGAQGSKIVFGTTPNGTTTNTVALTIDQNQVATFSKLVAQSAAEITSTPSGTTQTITLNNGNHQTLTLTSATGAVTATLTVPSNVSSGTIIVKQHASTVRDITWAVSAGTIKWMGTEPDWAADAISDIRIVSWRYDGSVMYLMSTDKAA